ncbi:MAG: hypothetical protein JOS17DRAFT_450837 [Linnemannia elongata]|nr:MAG: hypothetical protein JOS17DRAFT_450837 [Linnemannia elongata]
MRTIDLGKTKILSNNNQHNKASKSKNSSTNSFSHPHTHTPTHNPLTSNLTTTMSFIYNYFACDNSTPSEKENAAALKALIKTHKTALKSEIKQYDTDCKQTIKEADAEYKRVKKQAEETMFRQTLDAVNREIEVIMATDEYKGSDEKTKAKMVQFQSWVGCAGYKCLGAEREKEEKEKEVKEKEMKENEQGLPRYQDEAPVSGAISYPTEKEVLQSA